MAKKLNMIFGIVFVLVGILGFFNNPIVGPTGYFHADAVHSIVHLLVGIVMLALGGMAATSMMVFGAVYLLLAVIGFVEGGDKLLGFVGYNAADNWLHLVLGIVILGAGLMYKNKPATTAQM